jgi:glycine betaine/proline transport system ATP-binding protein
MQQRVGLARAFATDASILLMDEPFSALDPLIREHLQDELLELQRALQKTIVFVSHDLDEALKIGTRIAIMESGKIVQFGLPEDIVTKPVNEYVRLFVASMNPLTVLKGGMLMRSIAELQRDGPDIILEPRRPLPLPPRQPGPPARAGGQRRRRPVRSVCDGSRSRQAAGQRHGDWRRTHAHAGGGAGSPDHAAAAGAAGRRRQLLGVIGEHELYRGMLRQTELAKSHTEISPPWRPASRSPNHASATHETSDAAAPGRRRLADRARRSRARHRER